MTTTRSAARRADVVVVGAEWVSPRHLGLLDELGRHGIGLDPPDTRRVRWRLAGDAAAASPERIGDAVRTFFPRVRVLGSFTHDWLADERFAGTWTAIAPGEWATYRRAPLVHGRLAFAGGDLSPRWRGWIEGAVRSGRETAARLTAPPA
ncbi:MAG: FAD-dependent oxidoreductase [Actinomycetota bacterium]|nr:FAD-dependent oxidoreductase [Actinomycetota bacterium]